jgi:hypothetical protein
LTFEPNKTIGKFFLSLKDFGEMKADQSAKEPFPVVESKPAERRASVASVQFSDRNSATAGDRSERGRTRLSLPNIESTFQEIELHPHMKTRKPIFVGKKKIQNEMIRWFTFCTTFKSGFSVSCISLKYRYSV